MRTGKETGTKHAVRRSVNYLFIYLFIYLFNLFIFNNLSKVDKFAKIQYTYIHKNSHANWLIKVNYPILQKKKKKNLV